jgi:hypothetical protein
VEVHVHELKARNDYDEQDGEPRSDFLNRQERGFLHLRQRLYVDYHDNTDQQLFFKLMDDVQTRVYEYHS